MSKKILLISPPLRNMITSNVPSFVEEEKGFVPPLGILYVASYVREFSDHKVEILDAAVEKLSYDDIKRTILQKQPDIIALSVTTFTLIDSLLVAKLAKEISTDIHVCFGGPHTTLFPKESLSQNCVDSLILGEGEISFLELVNALDKNKSLGSLPGIASKQGDTFLINKPAPRIDDLDSLPFPARDLTPYKKYNSIISPDKSLTTMITSRGCPYECLFCNRMHFGRNCRFASAEYIVNEMHVCRNDFGIEEILVYDDTFTLDKKRAMKICDLIIERNLKVSWDIRTRVDLIDKELMIKLKKAGCSRIHFGVESGNQDILNILKKRDHSKSSSKSFPYSKRIGDNNVSIFHDRST